MELQEIESMVLREVTEKIKDGKTVKIEIEIEDNNVIKSVIISGDFFAYPVEEFERFQHSFQKMTPSRENLHGLIEVFQNKITLSGISFRRIEKILIRMLL